MQPPHEIGRATWTRPVFEDHDGAPGTALHVSKRHHHSDATYDVRAFHGHIKAGVADLPTGARDAHDHSHRRH